MVTTVYARVCVCVCVLALYLIQCKNLFSNKYYVVRTALALGPIQRGAITGLGVKFRTKIRLRVGKILVMVSNEPV